MAASHGYTFAGFDEYSGRYPSDCSAINVLYGLVPVGITILVFATLAAAYLGESMEVLG